MIEQYAHALASFLQANPNWGGIITFFIAFLESLAIVGTIVPGSVTMTAVGMLIGRSILPFWITLLFATAGAVFGDVLGYWIGVHYNERLRKMWPFKKHPQWLESGESFFHRHGGKSIIIGRFIGPLRSIIPLIAGLLHMPFQKFILADIPAAALWALAYMFPGILLGALSMQLPPKVATQFILILLLIILVISILAWLVKLFYGRFHHLLHHFAKKSWRYLLSHHRYDRFTHLLANKEHPSNYQQLILFFLSIISLVLFLLVTTCAFDHSSISSLNKPVFEFLRSIRSVKTDQVMIALTMLGDGKVLTASGGVILLWFLYKKYYREAKHFFIALLLGLIIPNLFKFLIYFPRPTGLLLASPTSSFPSGHTFYSILFFGTLASILATHIKQKYRHYIYYFSVCINLLVAFSRLYLGAHWVTDVLASFTLGYTLIALITISYRKHVEAIKIKQLSILALGVTALIWFSFFILTLQKNILRYSLNWPSQVIETTSWWGGSTKALPIYRENRLGQPAEPMNIQFSGDIIQLKNTLISQGWVANPNMTLLKNTVDKLSNTNNNFTTLLPSLYLNKPPVLFMTKEDGTGKLILKLWRSNIYLIEPWDVLYVGNIVEYQIDNKNDRITYSYNVLGKLIPYLSTSEWRLDSLNTSKIHTKLLKQNWKGKVLQISSPTLY